MFLSAYCNTASCLPSWEQDLRVTSITFHQHSVYCVISVTRTLSSFVFPMEDILPLEGIHFCWGYTHLLPPLLPPHSKMLFTPAPFNPDLVIPSIVSFLSTIFCNGQAHALQYLSADSVHKKPVGCFSIMSSVVCPILYLAITVSSFLCPPIPLTPPTRLRPIYSKQFQQFHHSSQCHIDS